MIKWIVMGASSFSGKAFCRHVERCGDSVVPLSRYDGCNFNSISGRSRIIEALRFNSDVAYVVNFAALNMVADSWMYYADYYKTNVGGVAWFARECQSRFPRLRRFIQVSTPEVYGNMMRVIAASDYYLPSTPYAASRAAADMDLAALWRATGFPVSFTRVVNVYGEGQQPYRLIPKLVLSIMRGEKFMLDGGGVSERSFIHIDDVARFTSSVAIDGDAGGIYHASGCDLITIRHVVEQVCGLCGVQFSDVVQERPERLGKDHAYILDDFKARDTLGWSPAIPFDVGLANTVKWVLNNPDFYRDQSLTYQHIP